MGKTAKKRQTARQGSCSQCGIVTSVTQITIFQKLQLDHKAKHDTKDSEGGTVQMRLLQFELNEQYFKAEKQIRSRPMNMI